MDIVTTISTMRHAHTAYNEEKRYAGTIDVPLNQKGKQDIKRVANFIYEYQFDVVVTSKQKRAIQTGRLLFQQSLPFVKSELCNERNFGIMEGLTWQEVQNLIPPVMFINVGNDLHSVNPKGGEPFEEVWERAKQFKQFLLNNYEGSNILVISHGVFLQMFHGLLRGLSCIQSLASYPGNLELSRFMINRHGLVKEDLFKLLGERVKSW